MFENIFSRKKYINQVEEEPRILPPPNYSLKNQYSFTEIVGLCNQLKLNHVFGYAHGKGPVAIIGINPRDENFQEFFDVVSHGSTQTDIYEFSPYTLAEAATVYNYFVYGIDGFESLKNLAHFDKISYDLDQRKKKLKELSEDSVIRMNGLLAQKLKPRDAYSFITHQNIYKIKRTCNFAIIDNQYPIAIIAFPNEWTSKITKFQDVWVKGSEEPKIQSIRFISISEARKINYEIPIYFYDLDYTIPVVITPILEKIDRTFEPNFNFIDENGLDIRIKY